jgi:hypothetical protein
MNISNQSAGATGKEKIMNLNIPVTPTPDFEPDEVRQSLARRDEIARTKMAADKATRLAGNAPAKKARKSSHSRKTGQMSAAAYLSAFEVTE